MKPMHSTSADHSVRADRRARGFSILLPNMDCHYRVPDEPQPHCPAPAEKSAARSFRLISRDYWQSENRNEFARELTLFAIVTLISAWSLIAMFQALASLPN